MVGEELRAIFQFLLDESGLPQRVEKLEQRRGVEAWEDGPARNPAPVMGERGERRPLTMRVGRDWCREKIAADPDLPCEVGPICDPTGTDPMPAVSPGDSSFAVFTGKGRWEP